LNALGRLLAVGSEWASYATLVPTGGARKAARAAADEASEQLGRQGARQAAQPRAGQKIYRVYGGDPQEADLWMAKKYSGPFGQSWTPIDPTTIPNYRQVAGLPDLNKGRFLIVAELLDPTGVKVQPACPYGRWRGGLVEYVLPQPVEARIRVLEVIGLNPPF